MELQERRQTTRMDCCIEVLCVQEERALVATVTNMGLGGMRLLCPEALPAQELVTVNRTDQGCEVSARVIWCRPVDDRFEAGLVYRDSLEQLELSWVKLALRRLGFEGRALYERRRHVRNKMAQPATLVLPGEDVACTLVDLGMGGALLEASPSIPAARVNTQVELRIPLEGLDPLTARIVYARGLPEKRLYGLCFSDDPANRALSRLVEGYLQSLTAAT